MPKYSPRSEFKLTSSRSPHGVPNAKSQPSIPGMRGMTVAIFGISNRNVAPKSSATSVAFFESLPRRYSICTVSPGSSLRASSTSLAPGPDSSSSSALAPVSEVPLNLVMTSPTLSPAFAAGPPGVTAASFAPILSV